MKKQTTTQTPPEQLDPITARKVLDADVSNLLRRVKSGSPLTRAQRALIEQHTIGGTTTPTTALFARNQKNLAEILGLSRQVVNYLARQADAPRPRKDGRLVIAEWQNYIQTRGTGEATDLSAAKLRGEVLNNWRKEFRNAALQGKYWPKDDVRRVCAQAIQSAKTRSFSGLPRLVTLTRLAKTEEDALKAAREEMIAVWRAMESCDWFKPEPQPATH